MPAARAQNPENQHSAAEAGQVAVIVTVTDRDHHPVTGLKAEDFVLYEDGQPQTIASISSDVPACIGLVVDTSGSMRHKLEAIDAALLEFVRAGNSGDRFFVVNFNDQPYLDQDFTNDIPRIENGLRHGDARAGTALYDAVIASADHLARVRECSKKALFLVSDGEDNESRKTLQQALAAVQDSGLVVYAIGLARDNLTQARRDQRALEALTLPTGGESFFLGSLKDVAKFSDRVAAEIRNQYTVSYMPARPWSDGSAPKIKIEVRSPRKDLVIRVGSGIKMDQPVGPAQPSKDAASTHEDLM